MANELTLTPLGEAAQVQSGQTVYVSLQPLVVPPWAWALGVGLLTYTLFGKKRVRDIQQRRRKKVVRKE